MIWIMILVSLGLIALGGTVWMVRQVHRIPALQKLGERKRLLSWLIAALPAAGLLLFLRINLMTMTVVLLHAVAGLLICRLAAFLARKLLKKQPGQTAVVAAAFLLTAIYLGFGWYNAHHVSETHYDVETEKRLSRDLRIVAIADAHLGITQDGESFSREMKRIQALEPDLVVVLGDFVDDDTGREDMAAACRALGELDTTYGVFYVFGNHDRGYFSTRDFSAEELCAELERGGVTILRDEALLLGGEFYLVGREDRSVRGRAEAAELTAELDSALPIILLDHQPNDYDAEAAAGADLVLSGHTHGGHIFPAGPFGVVTGANDLTYGLTRRGSCSFLVTSGISGWAIPFKTGCFSEFAVIDLHGTN